MTETKPELVPENDHEIVHYCKDCEEIVKTYQIGNKFVYKCSICGTKNVAFGSKRSIFNFFRLDEKIKKQELAKAKEERLKREAGGK